MIPARTDTPVFIPVRAFSDRTGVGINAVYEFARRQKPIPHIRVGNQVRIEVEAGLQWLREELGQGYGGRS